MNIVDSFKHVLSKDDGPNFFVTFWKEDLKVLLKDLGKSFKAIFKSKNNYFKTVKEKGLKNSLVDLKDSAIDTAIVFKEAPRRVKEAFSYFRDDLLEELEAQPDQKARAIFCMKVIGALTSFSLGAIQSAKRSKGDMPFLGLRSKNAFTQFLMAELVLKISQLFVLRFLSELEVQMDDEDDIKSLRYFKSLLKNASEHNTQPETENLEQDDAISIVENLRNYILTGERA